MPKPLFTGDITRCCACCARGRMASHGDQVLCPHKGIVDSAFHCRRFVYDPLRRVPRKVPPLPAFDRSDFEL